MNRKLVIAAALATLLSGNVLVVAMAQTNGMDRRDGRRDNRQGARDEKQACKAGDEKSRPECRQDKRDEKQDNRGPDEKKEAEPAPAPAT
jgi:hypothetical protein